MSYHLTEHVAEQTWQIHRNCGIDSRMCEFIWTWQASEAERRLRLQSFHRRMYGVSELLAHSCDNTTRGVLTVRWDSEGQR
jgi:hypothetical protein